MNEDAAYRSSSQYRFWSFTPAKLAELRSTSNALAADHMHKALVRRRTTASTLSTQAPVSSADATPSVSDSDVKNGSGGGGGGGSKKEEAEPESLTVEEEVELLKYYCDNLRALGIDEFKYSIHVTATAIQFLKRFYLTHSLMEYAPKKMMPTALFLANKTDNQMHSLDTFLREAHKIRGLESLTRDSVLGPEFLFTQALRFHFDVRHPYRALKGITLEGQQLAHICNGHKAPDGWSRISDQDIRDRLLEEGRLQPKDFERRFLSGYEKAKDYLSTKALISDVYFHYSPSQIAFAAWHCVDPDFITKFLDIKLTGVVPAKERFKIVDAITACAEMLQTVTVLQDNDLRAMNKKMIKANKFNAQGLADAKSKKRSGADGVDERKIKKLKLDREANEKAGNDLFGPSLPSR
jgi:cyclin H